VLDRRLVIHIGGAGGTLVPGLGKDSVGGFAEELHCAEPKLPRYKGGIPHMGNKYTKHTKDNAQETAQEAYLGQ
jgi:hypothetical protein